MNDAMADRDKLYAWGLTQPFGGDCNRRRHISDSPGAYDFSISGDPSDASARRRGRAPIPSICPFNRRRGASGAELLKDLKLDTRGARIDHQNRVHAAHAAVMLADLRRAAA